MLVKNLKYVSKVVPQTTDDYINNLNKIKPDFLVHGDDWKYDNRKRIRIKVIKTLKRWSGKLIEPRYTKNISSSEIKNKILTSLVLSNEEINQNNINKLKKDALNTLIDTKIKKIEVTKYNIEKDIS